MCNASVVPHVTCHLCLYNITQRCCGMARHLAVAQFSSLRLYKKGCSLIQKGVSWEKPTRPIKPIIAYQPIQVFKF